MAREDLTLIVREEVEAACAALDITGQAATDLSLQIADRLRFRVGGGELKYVPKIDRQQRAAQVRAEFKGDNIDDLARKHNLTPRRVRQIVAVRGK